MCNTAKPALQEVRTGRGGGYNERQEMCVRRCLMFTAMMVVVGVVVVVTLMCIVLVVWDSRRASKKKKAQEEADAAAGNESDEYDDFGLKRKRFRGKAPVARCVACDCDSARVPPADCAHPCSSAR
jgi:hypothetical protein